MKKLAIFVLMVFCLSISSAVLASETNGIIDPLNKYAWTEAGVWLDFGANNTNIHITDTELTGYIWGPELGWISLNCSNTSSCGIVDYKVTNTEEGTLSGYAWSESAGWINFNPTNGGVSIDSSGNFIGYAWGDNIGWISFNCENDLSCGIVDYKVTTDWRPLNVRTTPETESGTQNTASVIFGTGTRNRVQKVIDAPVNIVSTISNFFKNKKDEPEEILLTPEKSAEISYDSLSGKWNVFPINPVKKFVFAPLPKEISDVAKQIPKIGKAFRELGITKMSDLERMRNAKFIMPNIGEEAGIAGGMRVNISELSQKQKSYLPTEIVYAKFGSLDYSVYLSLTDKGLPEQQIVTIVGKPIDLAIKEDKPVKSIKGYLAVKDLKRQQAKSKSLPASSLMASPLMALINDNQSTEKKEITEEMILAKFEYTDEDKDGIYTTQIQSPLVHGEYEIISIIDYKDVSLGKKELRLVTLVDPEGYIYRKSGNEEARVFEATVSLLVKNQETGEFETWPAKNFRQINPQKTDKSGSYSFLVPEGVYKIRVSAADYYDFESKEFQVEEGRGVHQNIEMKKKSWLQNTLRLFK